MQTNNLATEWTDEKLQGQQRQWQVISALSEDIAGAADGSEWERLLDLADQRQELIEHFFAEPVCLPLFQKIAVELDEIQIQHQQVLKQVQQALEINDAKTTSLQEARDTIQTDSGIQQDNH